jgi:nucleotide-binding universal stress UspA family protein
VEVPDMSDHFERILVPTDFSTCAEEAWKTARRLADLISAELVLVHVFAESPLWSESAFNMAHVREVFAEARAWAADKLEEWARDARAQGLKVDVALRDGVPHREILKLAADEKARMIVMGTHGLGGIGRALLGSVSDRIVRLAPCPVLTVREPS